MTNLSKKFYIKFRIDDRPPKSMNAYIVSEDLERVETWDAVKPTEVDDFNGKSTNIPKFDDILETFEHSISSFQNTVPIVMQMLPFFSQIMDDQSIREFARTHGELLQSGKFKSYAMDIIHLGEITRRIERSASIRSGVRSLPTMFFVGLVSAYDKFLAELIRSIFISRPELLSSSERNLSFKDLMEIGSLEAARERIIERLKQLSDKVMRIKFRGSKINLK